jgi:hypothetical protein
LDRKKFALWLFGTAQQFSRLGHELYQVFVVGATVTCIKQFTNAKLFFQQSNF